MLLGYDTVSRQVVKTLAEGARVDTADGSFQFAEAHRPRCQVTQDQSRPFVADDLHGRGNATAFGLKRSGCDGRSGFVDNMHSSKIY